MHARCSAQRLAHKRSIRVCYGCNIAVGLLAPINPVWAHCVFLISNSLGSSTVRARHKVNAGRTEPNFQQCHLPGLFTPDPLGRGAGAGLVAGSPVWGAGQGLGEDDLCQLHPQQEQRLSRAGRDQLRASSRPVIWPERNRQRQARMKYLGAHIPRKWKLTSKMKRCNVIYPGTPSTSPAGNSVAASAPPTCHQQAWGREVLPDPLPHQPSPPPLQAGQGEEWQRAS